MSVREVVAGLVIIIGFGVACVQAWVSPSSALMGVFVVAVSIVVAALIMSAGERDSA